MANNIQNSYPCCNAQADATAALCNNGKLRFYSGVMPARADDAAMTLLAELSMNATAFGAAVNGVITANAITAANAVASGTATHFRIYKSDGVTCVYQGTVGVSGCDTTVDSVSFTQNVQVSCSALTYTVVRGS